MVLSCLGGGFKGREMGNFPRQSKITREVVSTSPGGKRLR